MGYPTIYPTSTTVYNPEKCWNGYTVFQAKDVGATIVDMNGNIIRQVQRLHGFPNKLLPNGILIGNTGRRDSKYGYQDMKSLVQVNWEGEVTWRFDQYENIEDPGEEPQWMARQHHDYQREGNPVGYYVPDMKPLIDKGNTLILSHKNLHNHNTTDKLLLDDSITFQQNTCFVNIIHFLPGRFGNYSPFVGTVLNQMLEGELLQNLSDRAPADPILFHYLPFDQPFPWSPNICKNLKFNMFQDFFEIIILR